jgi:hypothetical protein
MTEKDLNHLWQSQQGESKTMSLAEIHARARKFNSRWRWGMFAEYAACVAAIVMFGSYALRSSSWMMQAGCALIIIATFFVAWQMHRRRPGRVPDVGASIMSFHRAELVRVREMFRTSWLWYLAPFVPGIALILLGRVLQSHVPGRTLEMDYAIIALCTAIVVLIFALIGVFNMLRAHWVQKQIDELDALDRNN